MEGLLVGFDGPAGLHQDLNGDRQILRCIAFSQVEGPVARRRAGLQPVPILVDKLQKRIGTGLRPAARIRYLAPDVDDRRRRRLRILQHRGAGRRHVVPVRQQHVHGALLRYGRNPVAVQLTSSVPRVEVPQKRRRRAA